MAESLQNITAILVGWSCFLLRIVLQDALREVTEIYPPLKLRVFVDDITAFVNGGNKELVEMAEKVLAKLVKEVEEKVLRLSITEGEKEVESKVIISCTYLEEELLGCSGLENTNQAAGSEGEGEKKCDVRFSLIKKNWVFKKNLRAVRSEEFVEDWLASCESVERTSSGCCTHSKVSIEEADGCSSRQEVIGIAFLEQRGE